MSDATSDASDHMEDNESALLCCHHCGERFPENSTRILADVERPDAGRIERIALHELCVPDDRFLRYRWRNMRVERLPAR